jgi:predicted Zn finger-like uncharacterized protein
MVIQCSSCDTRFKISDDKVKSGPVKVRCSKCKEVFTVQPPEEEQPVTTEEVAVAPENDNDTSPSLDDVDWGSLNSEEAETPAPAADEPKEDIPTDDFSFGEDETTTDDSFSLGDSADETVTEEDTDDGGDDFSFGDDDTVAEDEKEDADDSFSFGGSAETTADDFGFDEAVGEGAQDEFSFDDAPAATGDADDFDWDGGGTDADSDETEDSDGSLDFSSLEMADDEPAAVEVEIATQSVQVATPAVEDSRPSSVKGPQKRGAKGRKAGKRKKAKKKSGPLRGIMVLLLLLILTVGGSLFGIKQMGFWSGNVEELQDVDYVTAAKTAWELVMTEVNQLAGTEIDNRSGTITITEMNGRYVQNATAGTLLVIEGNIRNDFKSSRTAIAVKGILYDQDLNIIRESKVYCGNAIDGKTLQTGTVAKMQEYTDNPFGDRFSNEDVAPGTSLPFTIIFNDIPENFSQFNVEIAESMVGS